MAVQGEAIRGETGEGRITLIPRPQKAKEGKKYKYLSRIHLKVHQTL